MRFAYPPYMSIIDSSLRSDIRPSKDNMNKSLTLTLRMPAELKRRLEREAKYQGVSLNQLTNYMLTVQLTQLETIDIFGNKNYL